MADQEESARTGAEARLLARQGKIRDSNTGLATGVYCNLVVLPKDFASDFKQLCSRNPVCLPLLEQLEAGDHKSKLAANSNVSTDVPYYNIYQDGTMTILKTDEISTQWGSDHVGFLLGCSFTFETGLSKAGLTPRNTLEGKTPPVYMTTIPLSPSGIFQGGHMIVSMRWYKEQDIERVRAVTRRYTRQHGEPVAWGWHGAATLGVKHKIELKQVDLGQWSEPNGDEVPVFWGCGVTAESAIAAAKLPGTSMTHHPGYMFVTDVLAEYFEK